MYFAILSIYTSTNPFSDQHVILPVIYSFFIGFLEHVFRNERLYAFEHYRVLWLNIDFPPENPKKKLKIPIVTIIKCNKIIEKKLLRTSLYWFSQFTEWRKHLCEIVFASKLCCLIFMVPERERVPSVPTFLDIHTQLHSKLPNGFLPLKYQSTVSWV